MKIMTDGDEIVISGIAGRFPNTNNMKELAHNLYNKVDMIDDDESRWKHFHPEIPTKAGKIRNIEKFDSSFFATLNKHANWTDPQMRMLLEHAYEAILDAGVSPQSLFGSKTGVFIGCSMSDSRDAFFNHIPTKEGYTIVGNCNFYLSNRLSYALGLCGPSFTVDTACSSSAYALDAAYKYIMNGDCDAAIVGGSCLILSAEASVGFNRIGVLAEDGVCRPFDENASGFVRSETVSAIFLQKKKDAKRVYASVIYTKTNNDGFKKEGSSLPSKVMQQKLMEEFYSDINFDTSQIHFVEAHATGTKLGDPQEASAIDEVLCKNRKSPLYVGSIKGNMGHAEAAAGLASMAKVILAFENNKFPPNINITCPRTDVEAFNEGRMKVVTDAEELRGDYIALNSFGLGGANAHILFKKNLKQKVMPDASNDQMMPVLVAWSGRTESAVDTIFEDLQQRPIDPEYVALLHSAMKQTSPANFYRGFGIFSNDPSTGKAVCLQKDVKNFNDEKRPVVWVFSGIGSQWNTMGTNLMNIPMFADTIDACHKILLTKGLNLKEIITTTDKTVFDDVLNSYVGIISIEIALTNILKAVGLNPDFIIGHSLGELGVAYADGCLTLEETILAAYARGTACNECEIIGGAMAAIGLNFTEIETILPKDIDIACHNGIDSTTISGPADSVRSFVEHLKDSNVFAREVACSGIPLHSRYIKTMGEKLSEKLRSVIKNPRKRSAKWLSSSYPESQWSSDEAGSVSAKYFTRNLLNPVYFEEVCKMLPVTSLLIEVAPHGLFRAILKKNLKDGDHLSLTQRNTEGVTFLLEALGRLFQKGIDIDIAKLYKTVEFPVSCGTSMISPQIKWNHTDNYLVPYFDTFSNYERRKVAINLSDKDFDFINGHIVDGRVLFPATGWIFLVWETFSWMNGVRLEEQAVVLHDIQLMRATMLAKNQDVFISINIQRGTGRFEILEGTSTIATGYINNGNNTKMTDIPKPEPNAEAVIINEDDFFDEMRIRGYFHQGLFRGVKEIRSDCLTAKVKWNQNWITFMDSMTFCDVSTSGKRELLVPTDIRKMIINPKLHFQTIGNDQDGEVLVDVTVCPYMKIIKSGGVEIHEKRNKTLTRRRPREPVLEAHKFVPFFASNVASQHDAMKICTQILFEASLPKQLISVEVDATGEISREPLSQYVTSAVKEIRTVICECNLLTQRKMEFRNVIVDESKELSSFSNVDLVIGNDLIEDASSLETAFSSLSDDGLIVSRECKPLTPSNRLYQLISRIPLDTNDILHVMKLKKIQQQPAKTIQITPNVKDWLEPLQDALMERAAVVLYAYQDSNSGILGFINCLRREPSGEKLRCFFINDQNAPKFNLELPFYKTQFDHGHIINVFKNGQWGGYRHLRLSGTPSLIPRNDHVFANSLVKGDLSSVLWLQGHMNLQNPKIGPEKIIKIQIASLNFKDVMLALGTLDQQSVLGFEFAGVDGNGRRVMGISRQGGGLATYYDSSDPITWDIPDKWSFEEAATVPLVYFTVYFAFFVAAKVQKGKSILIHAGSGGVGQAAIQVAFAYGLEVFTTVSTDEKRNYLLERFPQLRAEHIGNSRDTTFEKMIQLRTKGRGVDFVLNSLSDDKLQASIRCLGMNGTFLEIGQYDIVNRTKIHMGHLSRRIHFKAVFFEDLPTDCDDMKLAHALIVRDIKAGIIRPLRSVIFEAHEIESAFRLIAAGKHIGKVLLKIRDNQDNASLPIKVHPRVFCDPDETYIIVGGLGGFGMELADWLVTRGCRKLVLSSRRGISQNHQLSRIQNWKTSGATTVVTKADASSVEGCKELLDVARKLGPIGAIFNLAVVLRDAIFENQTEKTFEESLKPKVDSTKNLSELSQLYCPDLKHFVTFSSVACGRGNAGQTNYGLANSIMERIVESRVERGLPGKAIQWGAIGDVGLLAKLQAKGVDLEIDGTMPQDLRSCLDVLDTLLTSPESVVSSMVVGDKLATLSSKGNIIDTILRIMALRDRNLLSMHVTLARLGIDSLMSVEIRQILERDYNITISSQELRSLSLKQLERRVVSKASDNIGSNQQQNKLPMEVQLVATSFGDESKCNETLVKANNITTGGTKVLMIPGFFGMSGDLISKLVEDLGYPAYVLQIFKTADCTEIEQVVDAIIDDVLNIFEGNDQYFIVGYSFGSILALKIAFILEAKGKTGQIALIDASPDFMYKVSNQMICDSGTDEMLKDRILKNFITGVFMDGSEVVIAKVFERSSWDGRIELMHEFMADRVKYSTTYIKKLLLNGMFSRLKICVKIDKMRSQVLASTPITLFKSSATAMTRMDEAMGLDNFTVKSVDVQVVDGDHITILLNPKLPQLLKNLLK
ncbi:hypothetical protein HA402_000856 [Bradysia odoriphaga]|nr:hypothetical protein HA402_000856 [Bradysia odoriphaga]